MSIERAREHLKIYGIEDGIMEFDVSSATVELAAQAIGVSGARIAKSLSFITDSPILVVAAGDAKVDNRKFKDKFCAKAKMIPPEKVEELIGHAVGGVCPFGVNDGVRVYLDVSLKRFDTVFPACGSSNSAIEMSLDTLEKASGFTEWIDVCKIPEE